MLTPKREKFCQEMAKCGNQYQAFCKAFNASKMSRNAIDREASILMKNPKIAQRLKELAEEIKSINIAEAKEVQEILTKIIRGEMVEEVPMIIDKEAEIIKKHVTPKDRIKASEILAKMRGYFELNNGNEHKMPEIHIHGIKI